MALTMEGNMVVPSQKIAAAQQQPAEQNADDDMEARLAALRM